MDIKSLKLKSAIEALSVAAVVLSLIFVGLEVNESTRATRSATAAETTATIAEWYTSLSERIHPFKRSLSTTRRTIEVRTE